MDGKLAASGGEDGTLSIIDVATAKEVVPRIIPHTIDGDDSDDEEARKDGRVSSNTYHCNFITVLFFPQFSPGSNSSLFTLFMFSLFKGVSIQSLAFTVDGKTILVGDHEGAVTCIDVSVEHCVIGIWGLYRVGCTYGILGKLHRSTDNA